MLIQWKASRDWGPRMMMAPMCETSKIPTPVRTAKCSFMSPPVAGYSTGMSHPPKSTILAPRRRCIPLRAVLRSAGPSAALDEDEDKAVIPLDLTQRFERIADHAQTL